jgi:hypothetical protein
MKIMRSPGLRHRLLAFAAVFSVCGSMTSAGAAVRHVIVISVDGMGSNYVTPLLTSGLTNELLAFKRFQSEGSGTLNARDDPDYAVTLPNHVTMMTSRGVLGAAGHGWTSNDSTPPTATIAVNKGSYVASGFDVAHDRGLRTGIWSGKSKFSLFQQSYGSDTGTPDITGDDNGRDKIDYDFVVSGISAASLSADFTALMAADPFHFTFVYFQDPDAVGHSSGWSTNPSSAYAASLKSVDVRIGEILQMLESHPSLHGTTAVILTADHGGHNLTHGDTTNPLDYTIPFYVWGPGVAAGGDLYTMNAVTRTAPGATSNPPYTSSQPIRNGDAANLALQMLGLPSVPGSTINALQNLEVEVGDDIVVFGLWIEGFDWVPFTGPDKTPMGDPDLDGLGNAVEYVLGSNPTIANQGGLVIVTAGSDYVFTFPRAVATGNDHTGLAIEVGTNLDDWPLVYQVGRNTDSSTPGVIVTPGAEGYDVVALPLLGELGACRFARMRVNILP